MSDDGNTSRPPSEIEDLAGSDEEENFEDGMRQNAMEFDAQDKDQDNKLDLEEFCAMVRSREEGDHTDEELKERFIALDGDGSGKVDMNEYIRFSLRDAAAGRGGSREYRIPISIRDYRSGSTALPRLIKG